MTLLYMYFDNGQNETYKGIKPNPAGYRFDNRFNVEFDGKTFKIDNNPNYVQIYNSAISNISCIVGKNGSGKTTFIELLLSNIVWGMTPHQPEKMISIYYAVNEKGEAEFFLHIFKQDPRSHEYELVVNSNKKTFGHNHHVSHTPGYAKTLYTSTIPKNTKYIFHSLSPFDKVFYSIGKTLKDNRYTTSHYIKQMNYIGTQSFFKDDVGHEIKTVSNLIQLFTNEFGRAPFEEALGYTFSKLNISFENMSALKIDELDSYIDSIENALAGYTNIIRFPLLQEFQQLSKQLKKDFFSAVLSTYPQSIESGEDLRYHIIVDNIDFERLIYVGNLNKFLELINFSNLFYMSGKIQSDVLRKNILDANSNKKKINFYKNLDLINYLFDRKELLHSIFELSTIDLTNIEKLKNIAQLKQTIKLIRTLQQKQYLDFKLYLTKNDKELDYFFLSSGEKTMISYFANLIAAVSDFTDKNNNTFIIFIDEVELHLHPEWQRSFIDYINKFFRQNKQTIKFQFIIATHSPFVLSDIVEEQIVFINENKKRPNEHNTFGANIYDIFEKGFFLENSIGKCSENYIKVLSNIIYLFKALKYAENSDTFLLRNYLQKFYEIDRESKLNIQEQKDNADKELIKTIIEELKSNQFNLLKDKVYKNAIESYTQIHENTISLASMENMSKYISVIGEPTIRAHLEELCNELKDFVIYAD